MDSILHPPYSSLTGPPLSLNNLFFFKKNPCLDLIHTGKSGNKKVICQKLQLLLIWVISMHSFRNQANLFAGREY